MVLKYLLSYKSLGYMRGGLGQAKHGLEILGPLRYYFGVILLTLMTELLQVQVAGVLQAGGIPNIVLVDTISGQFLLIGVSSDQAMALQLGIKGLPTPRPMTHDLFLDVLDSTGWQVESVVIDRLEDNVFYARLIISKGNRKLELDARPSDALNLAVRARCPVFVDKDLIEKYYKELMDAIAAPKPAQEI